MPEFAKSNRFYEQTGEAPNSTGRIKPKCIK